MKTAEQKKAIAENQRVRYHQDPVFRERCKEIVRRSAAKNKDGKRHYDRAVRYGITRERAAQMDAVTHCEATGLPLDENPRDRVIDHNHETGIVRGVLHTRINLGLGLFDHDPSLLRAAADYLERTSRSNFSWEAK